MPYFSHCKMKTQNTDITSLIPRAPPTPTWKTKGAGREKKLYLPCDKNKQATFCVVFSQLHGQHFTGCFPQARDAWWVAWYLLLFLSVPMLNYTYAFYPDSTREKTLMPSQLFHTANNGRAGRDLGAHFRHLVLTNEIAIDIPKYPYLGALSEHRDKTILSRNL